MSRISSLLILVVFSTLLRGISIAAVPPETPPQMAFVGVHVVPMTGERVIENATVLVKNGVIDAIGPAGTISIATGTRTIDARGKYLMPGLAEMHAHVPGSQSPQSYRDDVLFLYVANGVTLARGMLGAPEHLQLRADLDAHRLLGPRLITSGPSLNGQSVTNAEQAVRAVRAQKAAGYDFLKLHPGLSVKSFKAIAETSREVGIEFAGHVSSEVGLALSLEEGQASIDHLDGYLQASVPEPALQEADGFFSYTLVEHFDERRLANAVRLTRAAGTWVVPTQTLFDNFVGTQTVQELDTRPEMRYVPARLREQYRQSKSNVRKSEHWSEDLARRHADVRNAMIRALHRGGVGMLLGSDAPQVFNVPGFSTHRELQAMVDAGLTPYEALRTGTVAPAVYFGDDGGYGAVVVGAEADLVLVDGNPLADIGNAQRIEGVMVRGRWLDRAFIERGLRGIEKRIADES